MGADNVHWSPEPDLLNTVLKHVCDFTSVSPNLIFYEMGTKNTYIRGPMVWQNMANSVQNIGGK